jgi:hypothetical protein
MRIRRKFGVWLEICILLALGVGVSGGETVSKDAAHGLALDMAGAGR